MLDGVTFDVDTAERVIILGQNGAGKTTLLRCLLGHYRLDEGEVRLAGFDPVRKRRQALSEVAFIPQLPPPLPVSIEALIRYAHETTGTNPRLVKDYAARFGLDVERHLAKPFNQLSGGMKQKFLASLAFARGARIMLFDEPTANLDPEGREAFRTILQEDPFRETTMIFISHRIEELNTILNRAVWLDLGKVVNDERL